MIQDPALMGTLNQILLPMVALPALSKEVEVSVVYAICLFSVRDGHVAKSHWRHRNAAKRISQCGAPVSCSPYCAVYRRSLLFLESLYQ